MAAKLTDPDKEKPGISPKKFLAHYNNLRNLNFAKDQAVALIRVAKKQAKADGANLDGLAMMEKLAKMPPDEAKAILQAFVGYSVTTNQDYADLPLFAAMTNGGADSKLMTAQMIEDAEYEGRLCGCKGGNKNDNPHRVGTEFHVKWAEGFDNGWAFFEARPQIEQKVKEASGRGRGRPPGSKNKEANVEAPAAVQ
jgi:hypothetical protein